MRQPVRRIFEGILAEIERLTRALEILESTVLHGFLNLAFGNQLAGIHNPNVPTAWPAPPVRGTGLNVRVRSECRQPLRASVSRQSASSGKSTQRAVGLNLKRADSSR